MAVGADTYISGDIGHHHFVDAPENKLNIIAAGHFFTENPVCEALCKMINAIDSEIECEIYCSNTTLTV